MRTTKWALPIGLIALTVGLAQAADLKGTISVSVVPGAMYNTVGQLAKKYEAAHPGVTVNLVEEPSGGAFEALIAAGNQPDLLVTSFGAEIGKLAGEGAVIPLENLAGAKQLLGDVLPASVTKLYGHNYYVPIGADVTMMIYNKQLFKDAGLDPNRPPATWDEFLADAAKIQALSSPAKKIYGTVFWNEALVWGSWYWNMLQPLYLNANKAKCQLINSLGTAVTFNQPACKLEDFFAFLAKAQKFAPPTMDPNFFSRKVGMWLQYGYSWQPNLQQAADKPMVLGEDVGVAAIPVPAKGATSYSTYGGRALMVMKTNPTRQAIAYDFLQYLMQKDNNLTFLKALGYLPVLKSLQTDPYFQDATRKPFIKALGTAVLPQMTNAADDAINALLTTYQQVVVEGKMTPAEGVKTASDKATKALGGQ